MSEENQLEDIIPIGNANANENLIENLNPNENNENNNNEGENEESKKVNSFNTILSIWNTMIGSSTVSLPYNVYYSGIIPAIFLSMIYGLICFYTCKIYNDFGAKDPDFSITVEKYFKKKFGPKIGQIGKFIQILFCCLITIGGALIYFLIVNQNLYPICCLLLNKMGLEIDGKNITPEFDRFSIFYLGIIVCFILFYFLIKREVGFLIKLSSSGIYFISILIIFVIYTGISSLINTEFDLQYIKNNTNSKVRHLKLFGENPAKFAGTLSLGYFCHTAILPILNSNKNQNNNNRDLFLGYSFVCLTFSLCGILGYIGFSGSNFEVDFKDNWFMFFDYDNYFILFLRFLNVFQLLSVFPILIYVVRLQIFNFFYGNDYPSRKHVIIYAISVLFLCLIVLYFAYNFLGNLLAIIGATTSFILIYTFPPLIKMINYYLNLKGDNVDDNASEKNNESIEEEENNKINDDINIEKRIKKEINRITFKDILYFIGQSSFIIIGIITVVFQFVPINVFRINLKDEI